MGVPRSDPQGSPVSVSGEGNHCREDDDPQEERYQGPHGRGSDAVQCESSQPATATDGGDGDRDNRARS